MVVDTGMQADYEGVTGVREHSGASNIILIGASGAGKSVVGYLLSRLLGYGFLDLDKVIEAQARQTVEEIFAVHGEAHFRRLEGDLIIALGGVRSHVLAAGGGAVMDDGNWGKLAAMGTTVWINTPAEEIARRLLADEDALRRRPLLADVLTLHKDRESRSKLLTERLKALIGNRLGRYRQAHLTVTDRFSTPDSTAQLVREALLEASFLNLPIEQKPYDRWQIL